MDNGVEYQNAFCDETFKGFIFACISDDPALTSTIRAANDVIRSGLRQRFTSIGRNELNTFMKENKTADLCKEGLTAGNDISPALLAGIMKLRVSNIRAERSGQKTDQVRPDSQPGGDVAGKKPAAKPGAKGVEEDQGGEDSRRKSKLRDKLPVKSETKVPTIDDEPTNGPEAYLGIFDILTSAVLDAMCAEGVFVDVVINVKTNLFSGDSSSVRLAIENSWQSKSPLNRVIYKELTVADNLTGNELFDNLAKVCYDALTQRELHSQFYQHTAIVEIPIAKTFPDLSVSATYRASTESIEATDVERLFTAALIESITEAPHETAAPSAGNANRAAVVTPSESPAQRNELLTALNLYFENVAARLSFYRNGTDKIKETVGDLEDSTVIIPFGDANAERALHDGKAKAKLSAVTSDNSWFCRLTRALKEKIGNQQIKRSMLRKSQMLHISGKPVPLLDQALLQFEFEKIAKRHLDSYHWIETMDKDTLRQVIEKARIILPFVVQHYYAYENMVLIMLSAAPAKFPNIDYQKSFKFETMLPLGQYVAILSTKADFNLKPTQYIYRTTGPTELLNSWKNIQYDGVNFRFYRQPVDNLFVNTGFFYFNISKKGLAGVATDNDIHLFVQPDVSSVFTMRTNDGNAVKVYKNGFIQLVTDMPRTAAYKQTSPSRERFRIITPDGKIVRHTLGGETEVYWPSGSVFQYAQDQKSWTLVKEDGHRIQLDDKRSVNPLSPVTVGLENYPLERRSVLVREDLVSIDKNVEENFVRVQQRDNSVFEYTNESELRQFKIKSQQWFPDISVDRINCTVTLKWSQGYKLTVDRKKTGMQSVALNLTDDISVKVYDDGNSVSVSERTAAATFKDRLVFDLQKCCCFYTDNTGKSYEAASGGSNNLPEKDLPEADVSNSQPGANIDSVIEALAKASHHFTPRTTRFFALSPDGDGLELLRESDVAPFLAAAKKQKQMKLFEERVHDSPGTLLVQSFDARQTIGDAKYFIRRTLYRRDRLTEELRHNILQDYQKVEKMQLNESEDSAATHLVEQSLFNIEAKQPKLQDEKLSPKKSAATHLASRPFQKQTVETQKQQKDLPAPPPPAAAKISARKVAELHVPVSISNAIKANKELNSTQNYFATTEGKAFLARPQDFQRSTEVDRKPAASKPKSADSGDENGDDSPPKIDLHNLGNRTQALEENNQVVKEVPPIKTSNIPGPPDHFNRANRQKLADFCFAEVNPTLVKFPEGITKQIVSIKNLGTASLRFKVEVTDKNALAVAYEHGPIAPGMSKVIDIVRKSADSSSLTGQKVIIKTEWETINIKVSSQ